MSNVTKKLRWKKKKERRVLDLVIRKLSLFRGTIPCVVGVEGS